MQKMTMRSNGLSEQTVCMAANSDAFRSLSSSTPSSLPVAISEVSPTATQDLRNGLKNATLTRVSPAPNDGGDRLRALRVRRGFSTRKVADLSRDVASARRNEEFAISHARLTQIENEESVPSVFKLYTLSAIYGISFEELLSCYLDLATLSEVHHSINASRTHVLPFKDGAVRAEPVLVAEPLGKETILLPQGPRSGGTIPPSLHQTVHAPACRYGWIGTSDYTMYPLVRPGTFVHIEECQRPCQISQYRTEYDRPLYFIETRLGYICSWCEVDKGRLTSIPHPLSPCRTRRFVHPTEAEIVGRVVSLELRLTDAVRCGAVPAQETHVSSAR
jgi:transcriptional regulator with XRE-family HTH domain